MVIYSDSVQLDLENILFGLVTWKKSPLSYEHAISYIDDIRIAADSIDTRSKHRNCTYNTHKKYGEKVMAYKRNRNTTWYVIYDWDEVNRIAYVNKIINNYNTVSGLH